MLDPYTGTTVTHVRGGTAEVDVDHVVPLGHAIRVGAASWSQARREAFAGDLTHELLAVEAGANRAKGDAPPDGWLPPNKAFRCGYAVRWITIKASWALTVTAAEKQVLARQLDSCRTTVPRTTR